MSALFGQTFYGDGGYSILSNEKSKGQCFTCFLLFPDPIFSLCLYLPALVSGSCLLHSWGGLRLPKCCAGQKRAQGCQLHGKRQIHKGLLLLALLRTGEGALDSSQREAVLHSQGSAPKAQRHPLFLQDVREILLW